MALTDSQKASIRRYLGYPDVNRGSFSELEGAMLAISSAGETVVATLLTALDGINTRLTAAWDRQNVIQVEDVKLAGPTEIQALRSEGDRLARDLAQVFDLTPRRLPFSSGSGGAFRRG